MVRAAARGDSPFAQRPVGGPASFHEGTTQMMLVRTHLAQSAISGLGAYASFPIAKGSRIWRFEPSFDRLIHKSMLASSPEFMADYLRDYAYPHPEQPDWYIVEIDNGRFINHHEVANTDFREVFAGYATRDIAAGEEITANYAEFDLNFRPGDFVEPKVDGFAGQVEPQVIYVNMKRQRRAPRRTARAR
jgi:SET domain-containing protein